MTRIITDVMTNVDRIYVKGQDDPVFPMTLAGDIFITTADGKSYTSDLPIHRLNGPAIIYLNGDVHWYVEGVEVTEKVILWLKQNKIRHWSKWTSQDITLFKMKFCG